jgi:hypothetical protein
MARGKRLRRTLLPLVFFLGVSVVSLNAIPLASADNPAQGTQEYCLSCHADPSLQTTLPSGEVLSLHVSPDSIQSSLHHQAGIECIGCHSDIREYPHPEIPYESRRELSRAFYLTCKKCHEDNYDKTQDSIHAEIAAGGNLDAPVCTDCHSAHTTRPPDEPTSLISETCGHCHTDVYKTYKASVHGSALIEEDNPDVPVCTDCHGVHDIQDSRTVQFHIESPELCAHCHADPDLMQRYGLSANVYETYSLSWHGVDVQVYKARWPNIWHESAVCTDCHGIHGIFSTENPRSSVHPDNLLATCQKCHPGTGPNWTGAWTGHEEVTLEQKPFVFYTQVFYESFAPFVLWVCGIYVALQILRATVARIKRSLR